MREKSQDSRVKRSEIRRWLLGAVWATVLVPAIFWLNFGEIALFAWGVTIFVDAICLLVAFGLYAHDLPGMDPQEAKGGWADKVGGLWLVACAFGPLAGWFLVNAATPTAGNWHVLYLARACLCIGLPVLTALPLLRYLRGERALLQIALLVVVTALPAASAAWTVLDLREGPTWSENARIGDGGRTAKVLALRHTGRVLEVIADEAPASHRP